MIIRFLILLVAVVLVASAPAIAQQQQMPAWYLRYSYGAGTPNDAGRRGHCTATFTKDGRVKIESKGRRGVEGPRNVTLFETDALDKDRLAAIFKAADAALKEPPYRFPGSNEDGRFLRLERAGNSPARVFHNQMKRYADAPAAMKEFVELVNKLIPEQERIAVE